MKRASPSSWISAVPRVGLPAAGFQRQECFERGRDLFGCARDVETDRAMLGQAMALAAQFFELLGAQRLAQHGVGIARRIEAGAQM